jgi:hypothetical protein
VAPARALAWRELLAVGVLAAMVAVGAKLAFDAAAFPNREVIWSLGGSYPDWISGPFHGLGGSLTHDRFYGELAALCGLWAAAWALAGSIRLSWALTAVALLHAVFLLAPPIGLSDVFNYIAYGRLAVVHDLNPYVNVLEQVPTDPVFQYATWPRWTNPYGPLATLSFYPLGWLSVPKALWLSKTAAAATGLGAAWLAGATARRLGRPPARAVVFVALNPLWLAYAVGGAHSDLLIALALLAGVWLLAGGRAAASGAALVAAVGVKVVGGLALPFAAVGAGPRRKALVAGAAAAAVLIYGVALALWGPHFLGGLSDQRQITSPRSVPGLISRALGFQEPPAGITVTATALFALATLLLLWRTWRGLSWIEAAAWCTFGLLLAITWLMPWYVVWLLPLAALSTRPGPRWAALAITAFIIGVRWAPALTVS